MLWNIKCKSMWVGGQTCSGHVLDRVTSYKSSDQTRRECPMNISKNCLRTRFGQVLGCPTTCPLQWQTVSWVGDSPSPLPTNHSQTTSSVSWSWGYENTLLASWAKRSHEQCPGKEPWRASCQCDCGSNAVVLQLYARHQDLVPPPTPKSSSVLSEPGLEKSCNEHALDRVTKWKHWPNRQTCQKNVFARALGNLWTIMTFLTFFDVLSWSYVFSGLSNDLSVARQTLTKETWFSLLRKLKVLKLHWQQFLPRQSSL